MDNPPFSLSFGFEPSNYIDRIEEKEEILEDFLRENPVSFARMVIGCRGSGKTVFMGNLSSELSKRDDWIVVDPGNKESMLYSLAAQLYEKGRLKKLFLRSEFSFSFHGFGISIKGENPVSSVLALLEKMLEYLGKKGKKVLITVDEADNSIEMKNFLSTYQYFLRQGYKVRLLMTGLYENVSSLSNVKSLTFLYRCPSLFLGPLPLSSVAARYRELLRTSEELSVALSKATKGFAFAYQLLGYLYYESKEKEITPSLLGRYDDLLAKYVYGKTFADCSGLERRILFSISGMKPERVSAISSKAGVDKSKMNVYRDRLLKKGILVSPKQGYLAFALPRFDKFLLYQDEDLIV